MDTPALRDTLFEIIEGSLEAQLRAVRRLRSSSEGGAPSHDKPQPNKSMSNLEMTYDILSDGQPLHINQIIVSIQKRFGVQIDRESLVSALSKRIIRGDRFARVGKNIFTLLSAPKK